MKQKRVEFYNDGNFVTEDGTRFVMYYLNPCRGESNEPEYITEEIVICGNEGWVKTYQDAQNSWATSQERYHDEQAKPENTADDSGADPMERCLTLIKDESLSPEALLGLLDKNTEVFDKEKVLHLLVKFKEELNPEWQELLDRFYGEQKQFTDMAKEDFEKTGVMKSRQSYSKRHGKALEQMKRKFEAAGYEVGRSGEKKK